MSVVTAPLEKFQHWIGSLPHGAADAPEPTDGREARNGAATASYLFGILSPLPLLGLLFGVVAVAQGVEGLRYARRHPEAGGVLQSRMGIALGSLFAVVYLAAGLFLLSVLT